MTAYKPEGDVALDPLRHYLRNSYGRSADQMRQDRAAACDLLESQAARIAELEAALRRAREFIGKLRVPQDMKQAAWQVYLGASVLNAADRALSAGQGEAK